MYKGIKSILPEEGAPQEVPGEGGDRQVRHREQGQLCSPADEDLH